MNKQKLTKSQREEVARLFWQEEYTTGVLADMFHCSRMNVWNLAQRRKDKYKKEEQ